MIRLIFFSLGAILIAIATVFVYPIYRITRKRDQKKGDLLALHFVQWGLKVWSVCAGSKVTYKGLEYLPEDGDPVVYASNHRSLFDVILTYPVFKGRTGALAKIELRSLPLVGWWIRTVYGVLIDRKDVRQGLQCILQCIDNLRNGISMLVYPEGTRGHVDGDLLPFHKGTFKVVTKSKVRVIPVAIVGTGDMFDDHRPFFKSRRAIIEFCEPVETCKLSPEELGFLQDTVHDIILERITANLQELNAAE
ncbi:MAG: 1-acyl-sn-glycerol-3-phosphate acyltransferase [Parasporobacterium sp.]|nr:1-acyl-sn-glycerol-3-phosphate acyltransferase [Parasporobacterium sp.]